MDKLSERLKEIVKDIGKLQADANSKGYSIDFESVLIGLEGHLTSIEYYENNEAE